MAKDDQIDYSDFEKYQYGALAAHMLGSKENQRYAPSALEVLAGEKGLNLGEEALGFIRGTQASEKGIQIASSVYAEKFQEKRGKYKVADLAGWYDPILAGIDPEDRGKILKYLGEHSETIGSIEKKVAKANHIVEGEDTGANTPEQISEAKKTLEKYSKLVSVLNALDNYKFEKIRPTVVNEARKADLRGLASKL